MQRYFIDQVVKAKEIKIKDSDYHHIKNVMRMVKDDLIEIVDLDGFIYLGRILDLNNKEVTIAIEEKLLENNELNIEVTLALGLVNRNKTEEVLRRAVELGASKFLSVKLKRSVIKHIDDKLDRKEKIVKEASEQSKRSKLMAIEETKTLKELIEYSKDYDLRICCYEEAEKNTKSLKDLLKEKHKKILVLTGPEGGFEESEIEILKANDFKIVSLGKRILRAETAPLAIMAIIAYESEQN